ncbi:hypothetical protein [Mycolicibacterium fallax]|uniref:hypothetical protein n=1 Tax=Mycolicibacterium fallax TaxID=1793 RepID=UPI001056D8EC|nr:hypothetical protein [Mycolicibacterium fallax]BBY99984.1 hypothetical protein MFAL_34510 [Mycolicibacterium fallax]
MSDAQIEWTESDIRAADPQRVLNLINAWPQSVQRLAEHGDAYVGAVRAPEWSGNTAGTIVTTAVRHNATIADDADTTGVLQRRATTAMDNVIRARSAVLELIDDTRSSNKLAVSDNLRVTATDLEYQSVATTKEMAIRQATQKWSAAEQFAASEIRAGAQPLTGHPSQGGVQLVDNRVPLSPAGGPFPQDIPNPVTDENDLQPPEDSGRLTGHWRIDRSRSYDTLPDFPTAPNGPQIPSAEHRQLDKPIVGASTGMRTIGSPQPGSVRGGEPALIGKESYKFRITGETFTPNPGHVQWIQDGGKYYMAQWIDHDIEVEHVKQVAATGKLAGLPQPFWGLNDWQKIDNSGIFAIMSRNPGLNLYIPDMGGQSHMVGPGMPAVEGPTIPQMTTGSPLPSIPSP